MKHDQRRQERCLAIGGVIATLLVRRWTLRRNND